MQRTRGSRTPSGVDAGAVVLEFPTVGKVGTYLGRHVVGKVGR